jgi:hypothetical protein
MRLSGRHLVELEVAAICRAISEGRSAVDFAIEDDDGALQGPFACLPYSPQIGDALQRVGIAIRESAVLDDSVREAVILTVASRWRADYEWYAHEAVARRQHLLESRDIDAIGSAWPVRSWIKRSSRIRATRLSSL